MVQNFAHFQQFCHPGSKGNRFSSGEEVPRCEAACAVCAQKDYLEHPHKLSLFGAAPEHHGQELCTDAANDLGDVSEGEGEADAPRTRALLKHRGVYYLQSPQLVQKVLDVDRYSKRWPLIPPEELHASSVGDPCWQAPLYPWQRGGRGQAARVLWAAHHYGAAGVPALRIRFPY